MRRGPGEVLRAFAILGLTSFGGPIAHLGYFREAFVVRRRWVTEPEYADLVALCQFLPGPASSQVGFALGLRRAGWLGALAAFVGFTLPSAVLMVAFASGATAIGGLVGDGAIAGLKIVAVAIVAQAVWGMAGALTPDRARAGIAVLALAGVLLVGGAWGQIGAIVLGAAAGLWWCRAEPADAASARTAPEPERPAAGFRVGRRTGVAALTALAALLLGGPVLAAATGSGSLALFDAFARAGALVFGGGHVVLPLLQAGVVDPGWVSQPEFLAGYGAAQAVPGPLFTFAAYLGALADVGPGGIGGAAIALAGVFAPGFLVLVGALPFWDALRTRPRARAAMRGANAAVVGILAAALYSPVFTTAITGPGPLVLAAAGFVALTRFRVPPWAVVLGGAAGGVALALPA